ncbi:MAG: PEGA domain-containing protein, partial [Bacteroidota bacterium]
MKKSILRLILFVCFIPLLSSAQETPGLLGTNGFLEREATTFSLDRKFATLVIESLLEEFTVEVNGRSILVSKEEEDWNMFLIPPGVNALTIRAEGYEALLLDEFTFRKNTVYDLHISIERTPQTDDIDPGKGSITIVTVPEGALLTVDGEPGDWMTPVTIPDLTPAVYTFRIRKENFDSAVIQVRALPDSAVVIPALDLRLRFGYLIVDHDPESKLLLNGIVLNNESNTVFRLRCGVFGLEVQKDGYVKYLQKIVIKTADTLTIIPELVQDIAYFDFSNLPEGTDIYLDNVETGRTVVETVPAEHTIRITTQEY